MNYLTIGDFLTGAAFPLMMFNFHIGAALLTLVFNKKYNFLSIIAYMVIELAHAYGNNTTDTKLIVLLAKVLTYYQMVGSIMYIINVMYPNFLSYKLFNDDVNSINYNFDEDDEINHAYSAEVIHEIDSNDNIIESQN